MPNLVIRTHARIPASDHHVVHLAHAAEWPGADVENAVVSEMRIAREKHFHRAKSRHRARIQQNERENDRHDD